MKRQPAMTIHGYNYSLIKGKYQLHAYPDESYLDRCVRLWIQNYLNHVTAKEVDFAVYEVTAASNEGTYQVKYDNNLSAWVCDCYSGLHNPDLTGDKPCSHIVAARFNINKHYPGFSEAFREQHATESR